MTWIDWITLIELPAITGLLLWIQSSRIRSEDRQAHFLELLHDHRIEVAQNYVTRRYLQEVEKRLTDHLQRIETKLN